MYKEKGDLAKAEYWLKKSLQENPKYDDAWICLGGIFAKQGKFEGAKKAYKTAIRLGTGVTEEAYLNLGFILRAQRKYKQALEQAEKALKIDQKYRAAKRLRKDLLEVSSPGRK